MPLVIDATNLRRSAREKGEDKVKSNFGQFKINMKFKCRYCFLISRKYDYMKSLFRSWNKSFSDDLSLKNHQRSKYCAKSDKTEEYWAQKEEEYWWMVRIMQHRCNNPLRCDYLESPP